MIEEKGTYIFNNFQLKTWLQGDKQRRRHLLIKLKDDLQNLGLSKRTMQMALIQLTSKSHVVLTQLAFSYKENLLQEKTENKHQDDLAKKQQAKNLQDIPQEFDIQTSSTAWVASIKNIDSLMKDDKKRMNKINKTKLTNKLSVIKMKPTDLLKESSPKESTNNSLSENVSSSENIISESKTYPEVINNNLIVREQNESNLEERMQNHVESTLVEHINMSNTSLYVTPIKENIKQNYKKIKIDLKSRTSQKRNYAKTKTLKRKRNSENLDENMSLIKVRKENETSISSDSDLIKVTNNTETLSDDESVTKQVIWKSIVNCTIKKKKKHKLLKQKRYKKENKIKKIRKKLHEYFRGSSEPNTSESEEEHEILLKHLKRINYQSDDSLCDISIEEETKNIRKTGTLLRDTLAHDLQEETKNATPSEIKSDYLHDLVYDAATEDKASKSDTSDNLQGNMNNLDCNDLCDFIFRTTEHSTQSSMGNKTKDDVLIHEYELVDESQKNIDIAKIVNQNHNTECTEKCAANDQVIETENETKSESSISGTNNSKKNIDSATPIDVKSNDLCDFINTEKYVKCNDVIDEETKDAVSICTSMIHDTLSNNVRSAISDEIKSDNCYNVIVSIEEYNDLATDKLRKNKEALCEPIVPDDNSQEDANNVKSDKSDDFISCEKNYSTHKNTREIDGISDKYDISNNLQESIKSKDPEKEQYADDSSLINDIKNNNKVDAHEKSDKDIASTIKMNLEYEDIIMHIKQNIKEKSISTDMEEAKKLNIEITNRQEDEVHNTEDNDSMQLKNIKKDAELSVIDAHESILGNVREKESYDDLQNVKNLFSTNKDIVKDSKTIDQLSMKMSETNSFERSYNASDSSFTSSNSNCDKNDSLNNHLVDDDINNDIEVEIKIKSKVKDRISRKFSLKAPLFAVNTCIKNLHKFKEELNLFDKFCQMDNKFEESNKSNTKQENNISLDNNENIEIEDYNITDHVKTSATIKNNTDSSQQQNFRDLNTDKNITEYNQRINKPTQPIDTIVSENNSKLNESDLGKYAKKNPGDKQKANEKHSSENNTILEANNMVEHNHEKKNKYASFIEQNTTQETNNNSGSLNLADNNIGQLNVIGNDIEPIKVTHGMSNVEEQLPQIASDVTHNKVPTRLPAKITAQYFMKSSTNLNALDLSKSACSTFDQSDSFHSTSSHSTFQTSSQSTSSELIHSQSISSQSVPFYSVSSQSAFPHSTCSQLITPQLCQICPQLAFSKTHQPIQNPQPINSSAILHCPQVLQSINSQSLPQSVSQPPCYDAFTRHMRVLPRTNSTAASNNTPNINNNIKKLIQIIVKEICMNISYLRNLFQQELVPAEYSKYFKLMSRKLMELNQNLLKLKTWLYANNLEQVMTYVSQYMPYEPITMTEYINYINIYQFVKQYIIESSQHSNIDQLNSNISVPNIRGFLRSTLNLKKRMPNPGKFMQSSRMSHPIQHPISTSNANQQQLFANSAKQKPQPKQFTPNVQPCTCCVPTSLSNINQQQYLGYANQYTPSVNMPNAGIQQGFTMTNNVSSSSTTRLHKQISQGNTNKMRQSHIKSNNTIDNTITVSNANAQQQKQIYFQTMPVSETNSISAANRNIFSGIHPAHRNIRQNETNMNQWKENNQQLPQAQSNPYINPNKLYDNIFTSQSLQRNTQTNSTQNKSDQSKQEILQQKLQNNQYSMQSNDKCLIDLTTDTNISNIVPQNVSNKRTKISELQKKASSTFTSNLCQTSNTYTNESLNTLGTKLANSSLKKYTVQNMYKPEIQKSNTALMLLDRVMDVLSQARKDMIYNFDISFLTNIQKIILQKQLLSYFCMVDYIKCSLSEQQFEQTQNERFILFNFDKYLSGYINNMIKDLQTTEKIGKDSQNDNISQINLILSDNIKQTTTDKITNIQSNQRNTNRSMYNSNLKKQSLEQTTNLNISKDSKTIAVKKYARKNLQYSILQNRLMLQETESVEKIINAQFNQDKTCLLCEKEKKSSEQRTPNISDNYKLMVENNLQTQNKDTRLQEQSHKTSKNKILKHLLFHIKKQSEGTEVLSSRYSKIVIPEKKSIMESSTNSLKTKVQDKMRIVESVKSLSPEHLNISEEDRITKIHIENLETETQDNTKINKLKITNLHNELIPELYSPAQNSSSLFTFFQTKKTEDDLEITNNAKEKSNNMENIHETSNIAALDDKENYVSQSSHNAKEQNKEIFNTNDEIFNENSEDKVYDNINENIKILNTEIQPESLNSCDSISKNIVLGSTSSIKKYSIKSMCEKSAKTVSDCLISEQENSTNDESDTEDTDSSGKLYIDESTKEEQNQEQCDKISFSDQDNSNILHDSKSFDIVTCSSPDKSLLKDVRSEDFDTCQSFLTKNVEIFNENLSEVKISLEKIIKFENECNIEENNIEPIDRLEEFKEEQLQLDEIKCENMLLKIEVSENELCTKENLMHSIYLENPTDGKEEKMELDTHNGIKMINEQLNYISEHKSYERSPSYNSVQQDDSLDIKSSIEENVPNCDTDCTFIKSDSDAMIVPSIISIKTISPSLYEKIDSIDTSLLNNSKFFDTKNKNLLDMNVNMENLDEEINDKPCLRCKRKSTVYCQVCLKAYYCSKRCSSLYWKAKHHKQCKRNSNVY